VNLPRPFYGFARIEEAPTVRKRVGSHVEDAHDKGAGAEVERPAWQLNGVVFTGRNMHLLD
jgi:hypothetical protein